MRGVPGVRCVAIAPGYVGTPMVRGMNQGGATRNAEGDASGGSSSRAEIANAILWTSKNEAMEPTCLEITGGLIANGLAK